ncbi:MULTISPECIES: hypothetical protein [unclassified Pseudoalteromonas]|uniref:hypothetical protein n=1 Tax=unclassified Pseudoalteromonas TaxID=194690 RepID=UPI000CF6B9BB|nr:MULTISPECIES: hypothetical protein [unclassified Pseudoalteromonas]
MNKLLLIGVFCLAAGALSAPVEAQSWQAMKQEKKSKINKLHAFNSEQERLVARFLDLNAQVQQLALQVSDAQQTSPALEPSGQHDLDFDKGSYYFVDHLSAQLTRLADANNALLANFGTAAAGGNTSLQARYLALRKQLQDLTVQLNEFEHRSEKLLVSASPLLKRKIHASLSSGLLLAAQLPAQLKDNTTLTLSLEAYR